MTILSIDHAQLGFPAGKHAQVRHFYAELIGLREQEPGDGRALRFRAGSQRIDLVPVHPWRPHADTPHLALQTENLSGLRARLLDAGVALDESRHLPGHRRFYVRDPGGNTLELLERVDVPNGQGRAA